MSVDDKVRFYNGLVNALTKGVKLAAVLDEQSRTEEAERVQRKNEKLARSARAVRVAISEQWSTGVTGLLEEMRGINSKLQAQLREIEKTLDTVERVVKALGYLDDLIQLAGKVL